MGMLGEMMRHPDEIYPLLKLKMAAKQAEKNIPMQSHWAFCYSELVKVSRGFSIVIQLLPSELRHVVCVLYLVLRALDTIEDDTCIPSDVKVPLLISFHKHIYNREWHFSCGIKKYALLMGRFHNVSTSFLELHKSYQEVIEDVTKEMGSGMAKFICKEVETVDDYDEYCHYVSGLVGIGLSRLFNASGCEDVAPDNLSNSMGLFLQKQSDIGDYFEDTVVAPKSRMCWPRQICSKYANKLEDLKYEENSLKAVQCLNDVITDALVHIDDCFKYMSAIRDPAIFRFIVIPQITAFATLALCYNNIEVFKGEVKMRHGLIAKVFDRTRSMADVYRAFFDFTGMMKSKVDMNDPNAEKTLSRLEAIQNTCKESRTLHTRKSYIHGNEPTYNYVMVVLLIVALAFILAYLGKPNN